MLDLGVLCVLGGLAYDGFLGLSQIGNPAPSASNQPSLLPGLVAIGVGMLVVLAHYVAKHLA